MELSARNGKPGYECEVCGEFVSDLRLSHICRRCGKHLCLRCSVFHFMPSKLPLRILGHRNIERSSFVCPDCQEILENEEAAAQAEKEEESLRPITKCSLCAANDEPPERKIFGYTPPQFSNCDRCGRLVCDQCIMCPPDSSYKYNLACSACYSTIEQEDARKREEYWREEEENKLEE